jgi:hypothetical protein
MDADELTPIVTAHQQVLTRHEREMADIRALAKLNQEQLNQLSAGMLELRNLIADYIQGRSATND